MKRLFLIVGVVLVALVLIAFFAFPWRETVATRYNYFDANSGRSKSEWVSFGKPYRVEIKDTEYSKLLAETKIETKSPQWKLCSLRELGILRFFYPQFVDYDEGRIEADCHLFALAVEMKDMKPEKLREVTLHFQDLVLKGDHAATQEYLKEIQTNQNETRVPITAGRAIQRPPESLLTNASHKAMDTSDSISSNGEGTPVNLHPKPQSTND